MRANFASSGNEEEASKSVQEVSKCSGGVSRGKTHSDYWLKKVFRPTYKAGGVVRETAVYSVKIQFAGERKLFPLNTANRADAAKKAKQIWASLVANGWKETLKQFKPSAVFVQPDFVTVGDYLDFLQQHQLYAPSALMRNQAKLFTVLTSLAGLTLPHKYRTRSVSKAKRHEQLRAVKLADLSPQNVELWKARYLASRSENPQDLLRAKHTLDGYLRAAKAIFGPHIRKRLTTLGVTIPDPIPFASAEFVSRGRSAYRYRSRIDPIHLTQRAIQELQDEKFEQLKIFLLALHLGLRRNEVDKLTWAQFDFANCKLHIEATEYAQLKTEGSEADVWLEPELAAFFQKAKASASGVFVITSTNQVRRTSSWDHYRAERHYAELCAWLRANGVEAQKPLHTLRKEFGRLITEKLGLFAASLALRHSTPTVTALYYADDTRPKVTGLGKLLQFPAS